MEQRSDEWFKARLGKVTASKVSDVVGKTKTGYGAGRANYMAQLVAERLTGQQQENFTNAAMQWGTDTEPQARNAYEFFEGKKVEEVGFIDHPTVSMSGASPDGLVGDNGLVEIKCPNTATHIEYLTKRKVPGKYLTQMYWQMACTGRAWCDFVSFDPRMPEHLQLWVSRVHRDENIIKELEAEVTLFLTELEDTIHQLNSLSGENSK